MWTAVNRFSRRVSSFDTTTFLTRDVVNIVKKHFRDIRYADRRYKSVFCLSFCQSLAVTDVCLGVRGKVIRTVLCCIVY